MSFVRRLAIFLSVSAVSIAVDQITKVIANDVFQGQPTRVYLWDTFRFQYATNDGAFLSLGAGLPTGARFWVLTIGVGLLLAGITVYALASKAIDSPQAVGYALIASGGLSNWYDRVRFEGSVVDFMNVGIGRLRSGVFNVADLAILAGIGVLLVHGWQLDKEAKRLAAAEKARTAAPPPGPEAPPAVVEPGPPASPGTDVPR